MAQAGEVPVAVAEEAPAAAQVRLGLALRELGRDEEAIAAFREALAEDSGDVAARINLGALLVEEGDEEGIEHLARVVEQDAGDTWALYELAEGLRRFDRWGEALGFYERLTAIDPAHENGRVGEAEALAAVGRFGESLASLEELRALFPASRGVKFGLAWLLAASPDPALRDGERAVTLAEELFTERRSLGALELVAAARAELGHCEEAAQIQSSVISQALHHERPAGVTARLARAAEWFASGPPCRVPPGQPADERPYWPRTRATGDGESVPSAHDH